MASSGILSRSDRLGAESLRRLHRDSIDEASRVRAVFERLADEGIVLRRGLTAQVDREAARVVEVREDRVLLRTKHFDGRRVGQSFFTFDLEGVPYFFEADVSPVETPEVDPAGAEQEYTVALPLPLASGIYAAERRSFERRGPSAGGRGPRRVEIRAETGFAARAEVVDSSYDGLAVRLPAGEAHAMPSQLIVRFLDAGEGQPAGSEAYARVRHRAPLPGPRGSVGGETARGWVRVGLTVSGARSTGRIGVERRDRVLEAGSVPVQPPPGTLRGEVPVVDFTDARGERMRAIVDRVGEGSNPPAVVIPPAWGKTKETLLPLAATITATFAAAGEPVVVLRFDGIRRRGESHNDPEFLTPGREFEGLTFSQGVSDIHATLEHAERAYGCRRAVVVTFSASAVEGRRAVANDPRAAGWVSVVGAADMQSSLRIVSGGLDFPYGYLRGVRFGLQEILGISVDMDRACEDGVEHGLWFQEDARRDMARIRVPVTWIHGRHDAWMELGRAIELLSCGDTSKRRLIEIPIGHQLRTSQAALETFQLVACEALRMVREDRGERDGARATQPVLPDLAALDERRRAERARVKSRSGTPNLRAFWADYLLGRDRGLGIDLMAVLSPYEELMALQVARLELRPGARVVDLGAGTGPLVAHLAQWEAPADLRIHALDFVGEAVRRARDRARGLASRGGVLHGVVCDLAIDGSVSGIPVRSGVYDAALASLLVGYLPDPEALLGEAHRLLRPGGRIVVSSMRCDADTSKLYVEGVEELKAGRGRALLGDLSPEEVTRLTRSFLNDAARLLDLEESGTFRFFDPAELVELMRKTGFSDLRAEESFGDPPQAVVVSARRPG